DPGAGSTGVCGWRTARHRAEEADVVMGVGASLNRHTLENGYMYPNAKYVHIDQKAHLMMGGGRHADAYVQSDAKIAVEELEKLLAARGVKGTGYRTPDVKSKLVNHNAD